MIALEIRPGIAREARQVNMGDGVSGLQFARTLNRRRSERMGLVAVGLDDEGRLEDVN